MPAVFIHIPEQHAGRPLSITQAIDNLATLAMMLEQKWPGGPTAHDWGWALLVTGLTGCFPAYVRSPSSGRYACVPAEYWGQTTAVNDPPTVFDGMAGSVGADSDMIGQPLVVWESDLEPLRELLFQLTRQAVAGSAASIPDTAQFKAALGRPRGTGHYPGDADIIRRVIKLCDNGAFTGLARVTHAIQSMIGDVEPRGRNEDAEADKAKVRRVRSKVLRERPDLDT